MDFIKKRILWADYAKFIAIYFVVLGHSDLPVGDLRCYIYSFHLPLFFIISGYFDNSEKYTLKSFLYTHVKSLIFPYVCFNVINIPFSYISVYLHPEFYPGIDELDEYILYPCIGILYGDDTVTSSSFLPCGPLWFLVALFFMKLFIYCVR